MNHGLYGLFHEYTTLSLSHWKFTVFINPCLARLESGIIKNGKLPLTSTSGGIYTWNRPMNHGLYIIYTYMYTYDIRLAVWMKDHFAGHSKFNGMYLNFVRLVSS